MYDEIKLSKCLHYNKSVLIIICMGGMKFFDMIVEKRNWDFNSCKKINREMEKGSWDTIWNKYKNTLIRMKGMSV